MKSGPPILWTAGRYFRRNEGTTDYAQFAAPIVLVDDFKIHFQAMMQVDATGIFLGSSVDNNDYFGYLTGGRLRLRFDGNTLDTPAASFPANRLAGGVIERVLGVISISVGGSVVASVSNTAPFKFDTLYRNFDGNNLSGILANLEAWDNGVLVTDCPIDESSGATIFDTVGGNNATIINGLDADRGKFIEQPTLWKGENLTAPPWDSVDQELLKS